MRYTGIIASVLIVLTIGISDAYGQKPSASDSLKRLNYYLYTGPKLHIPKGNGIFYPNAPAIDPYLPPIDSTEVRFNLSYQIGANIALEIISSFFIETGVELNMRNSIVYPYWDSTEIGNAIPYSKIQYLSHNLELPIGLSYNWKRICFGGGARIKVFEFVTEKRYLEEEVLFKKNIVSAFRNFFFDKTIYPNLSFGVLLLNNIEHPIWVFTEYEFGTKAHSSFYLSFRIKL